MPSPTSPASSTSRVSRRRATVQAVLSESAVFRSAQEIHHLLRSRGEAIGLSTVYRQLQTMTEDGDVDALRHEDGEVLYRRCSPKHHHHLVCRSCGRVEEVKGLAVESWAERAAAEHGFVDVSHLVEIFGVCPRCRQ